MEPIPISGDYLLECDGLAAAGINLNAATMTYSLADASGTAVVGGTGTMAYETASNGNYSAVVDATVTALLAADQAYTFTVTISQGTYQDKRHLVARAYLRGAK